MKKAKNRCIRFFFILAAALTAWMLGAVPTQAKTNSKITLNYKNVTMQAGSSLNLHTASAKGLKSSRKVTWKSSNKKVATVNKNGVVKAKKSGTVTITATTKDKKSKASCKVKVQKKKSAKSNVLVVYFSCTGTTKGIAKKIASATNGDIYRITPAKAYTSKNLDYDNDSSRATKEQDNRKCRPQLKGKAANIKEYDYIFIGYPIWWGEAPRAVSTFMESYSFSGKTIIPFCTSGSSGIGTSVKVLKPLAQKKVKWFSGKRFNGDETLKDIKKWIDSLHVTESSEPEKKPGEQPDNPLTGGKTLVAFFSCTNTTKNIAEQIAQAKGADLYQIMPEVPYTSEDLAYYTGGRADQEQNDLSVRPAISGGVENMAEYSVIYLGYPIWHGQAPRIISTFLESYDFSGKKIIPFCTSHSSGIGSSDANLHGLCPESVTWEAGKRFAADASKEEIETWLKEFGTVDLPDTGSVSKFALSEGKNGQAPTVKLNSGYDMPVLGLGTYSLLGDICVNSVVSALQSGYRKIDTAYMYHNEESVGEGVRQSGVPREEVFVATKLYPNQYANAKEAIDEALEKLNLGYIDLMLLHHPGDKDIDAYHAMERVVKEGKIRSIGLSNWYVEEMEEFLPQVNIMPALVQNEIHPYYQEQEVVPYMHEKGIVMEAWYPLGGRGYTAELLGNEMISKIATAHGKSAAQVILRWDLQNGVVVIPGSSNPDHIRENISIFDFELTDGEMEQIRQLDRNEKHDWY